ncbi:MAG: hypothetical protein ACOYK6_06045 [Chthoniobacterales bacterium]
MRKVHGGDKDKKTINKDERRSKNTCCQHNLKKINGDEGGKEKKYNQALLQFQLLISAAA